MTIEQKKHFTESLREYVGWANANNQQNLGQALPCHVVFNAGPIVTVAFDITTANNATFPQVTVLCLKVTIFDCLFKWGIKALYCQQIRCLVAFQDWVGD